MNRAPGKKRSIPDLVLPTGMQAKGRKGLRGKEIRSGDQIDIFQCKLIKSETRLLAKGIGIK